MTRRDGSNTGAQLVDEQQNVMAASAESEATRTLLELVAHGDAAALDRLFARYGPVLQRWAHGRLPRWARDIAETGDLVQEALLDTLRNIKSFEYRGEGAFFAYLRQVMMNRIRLELRRRRRQPLRADLHSGLEAEATSPLEQAIGIELSERYEAALTRLSAEEREAVIARVELRLSYREIAAALGKPSPDAARMAVARALVRLPRALNQEGAST